jgi:hypothetical protein
MIRSLRLAAAAASAFASIVSPAFGWTSSKVQIDANGRLTYPADTSGNRIPDYSHAGYKGGGVPLPTNIPVRVTVAPISGDDTANIQAAIDQVGALPVQADGYRGTVLLSAGVYDVGGTLRLDQSGVVLAGVGDGDSSTSNTILRRTGTSTADVITAGGGANDQFKSEIANTRREITTQRVTVGSRSFAVADASPYAVGDNIIILHPSTSAWITAMNNGGVTDANTWKPGEIDIRYHRYITAISGNTITIDAPVFTHLDRSLSISYVYKYDRTGVLTNIGIEDLQIDIVTAGSTSETHCEDAVQFVEAEDSWIRDCTIKHFWHAGVQFVGTTRSTVERVRAIEPHSVVTGGRRYNFSTYHGQLILFQDCFASDARHGFVANGTSNDSGNVVLRGTLDRNITFSEGHRRWSTGLLFDNIVATNRVGADTLGFYNRGNYGTGHGWAVGHGTIWNSNAAGGKILVQQPPTAQNYAIGCFGNVTSSGPFAGAAGYIEGANTSGLQPASLYEEQLAQRLPLKTPSFSPAGGTYSTAQTVTVTTASAGASIRYTTDGSTPSATVGTVYSGPITIGATTTMKAIAYRTGWTSSSIRTASYTINLAGPQTFEAESLTRAVSGATASVGADASASGGSLVYFSADGANDYVEFTLPNITAGTYQIKLRYKAHPNRGQHTLRANGTQVGGTLDQYAATAGFAEHTFGNATFATGGSQALRLTSTGKQAAAGAFTISADSFILTPQATPAKFSIAGSAVLASADDGNVPANAVDGSLATRWSAQGDGQWIRFDLGSTKTIGYVKLAFYNGDTRTSTFDVQTSPDGTTWTTRASPTSSGTTTGLETFDFTDVSARYVRILGHGNSVNLWNSYTEVEMWGF